MFNTIAARMIHIIMFILAAGTCACLYAELIITTKLKKDNGEHYNYSWLTYYLLTIAAMGALQTLLWIFQSRIYENGRPTVQECVLNAIFAAAFLFAAAWQFYQTFSNHEPNEFLCSTDSHDEMVHCRLWQAQLVGCGVCGIMFLLSTILWIILFRQRPMVFKDLPEDVSMSSPATADTSAVREDAVQREREEAAAIAAEAERRRVHQRQQQQMQQQQQLQRPAPVPRPTNPYQQPQQPLQQNPYQNNRMGTHNQLQHQGSSGYINQQQSYFNQQQYQQPRVPPHTQPSYSNVNVENESYYNGSYAAHQKRPSYEMNTPATSGAYQQHQHQHPVTVGAVGAPLAATGYTEEPGTYAETPGTSNVQYNNGGYNDYAYGQFNPAETFEDPASKEAQAHLAYAKQLQEQQQYHQNMAEVLQKQQQQKMQKQQLEREHDPNLPSSGSTASFYPLPPQHSATIPPLPVPSSSTSAAATAGASSSRGDHSFFNTTATTTQNAGTGMVTPGSTSSPQRPVHSPQQYKNSPQLYQSDEIESHYSDDRYRAELLGEVRKARQDGMPSNPEDRGQEYHDYKVQVASPRGETPVNHSRPNSASYVPPPPPTKSQTLWS